MGSFLSTPFCSALIRVFVKGIRGRLIISIRFVSQSGKS
jgi:hypothetical protein